MSIIFLLLLSAFFALTFSDVAYVRTFGAKGGDDRPLQDCTRRAPRELEFSFEFLSLFSHSACFFRPGSNYRIQSVSFVSTILLETMTMVRSSLVLRQLISRSRQSNYNAAVARSYVQSRSLGLASETFRGESNVRSILPSHQTLLSRSFSHIGAGIPSRSFSAVGESELAVEEEIDAVEATDTDAATVEDAFPNFADLATLHPRTAETLTSKGLKTMTEIQARTWEAALSGKDVIGRARTGTGKTMAFLLPSLERVLQNPSSEGKLSVLIISPTRELANQIGEQARFLAQAHGGVTSQVVYGGVSKRNDINLMQRQMPTILTATPGRLKDHLQTTAIKGKHFRDSVQDIQVLILDEVRTNKRGRVAFKTWQQHVQLTLY
jgi:hypothetical protein